jgi:UDP-glucose:(heptosyl)LPS alpha-1,3-glucosyltransferase
MNIAFCYESVLPKRGGCETYIADLARRLIADRHEVHLYACRWDAAALPADIRYHALPAVRGPRFLRPWRFGTRCLEAMAANRHDVSIGFDKTWGQDILFPQGGLHAASAEHNLRKYRNAVARWLARTCKALDLAHRSFTRLERRQYLTQPRPQIIVNSRMVRNHFLRFYGVPPEDIHVIYSAIPQDRLYEPARPRVRLEWRQEHGLAPAETVALFVATNYRLKGLVPLLYAVQSLAARSEFRAARGFRLVVAGNSKTGPYLRLARRLGVEQHVKFIGHCPNISRQFYAADFLVHPTFYDPCSLVVLEALACGLPVVTTRFNGASELLHPLREGYVIDNPHDHNHLAWCMAQLLDPVRRSACAHAARQTAAGWTFEHHYRQMLGVFATACRRKQAA